MRRLRVDDLWHIAWHGISSDYLLGVELLVLAVALLVAAWLPQTTLDGQSQDVVWQGEIQQRFGGAAWFDVLRSPLQTIGAFHVADAVGFRLLMALLACSLLARLVDSLEEASQWWQSRRGSGESREGVETPGRDADGAGIEPQKRPAVGWGGAALYLGGLIILLGIAVTGTWGWRAGPLALAPQQSAALGHGSELSLFLVSLSDDGHSGQGQVWSQNETLVAQGQLAAGQPLTGGGVGVYLVGRGTGLRIAATGRDGTALELETGPGAPPEKELILAFSEEQPRHLVGIPEADLVLLLMMDETEGQIQLQVQVFAEGSGEFILEQELSDETQFEVRDVNVSMVPITDARLQVVHDSGAFWTQVGMLLLLSGVGIRGWPLAGQAVSRVKSDGYGRPANSMSDPKDQGLNSNEA
jgi:hypothetical protein